MNDNPYNEIARENLAASLKEHEKEPDEDYEQEVEPSEEDLALRSLDSEHVMDYRAIKHAIARTDLAERLVDMAVKDGLKERRG